MPDPEISGENLSKTGSVQIPVSHLQLLLTFLKLGFTAFSFAILPQIKKTILKKGWLSDHEMDEGIALTQLYPGPSNFDFVSFIGFRLQGVTGALITALNFVLPSFLLMLGLSYVYFSFGNIGWVRNVFYGLEALVVGIIANLVIDMGAKYTRRAVPILLAIATFFALLSGINIFIILLFAIVIGLIGLQPITVQQNRSETNNPNQSPGRIWLGISMVVIFILAVVTFCFFLRNDLGTLALSLFKVGSIAFGNGASILPVIRVEVVDVHHWFTPLEFADGTVLGQITPGPFLITSTFFGFKMGGILGALLCTFAVFSPTFAMTLIFTQIFSRVKNLRFIQKALAGILAAFVGLLALVAFQMAQVGIRSWISLGMAALAFTVTRFLKWDVLLVILAGMAVWAIILLLGLPV